MNELKHLTNVVIRNLSTLVHKQNCSNDSFYLTIYNILRYKLVTIPLKTVAPNMDRFFCFNSTVCLYLKLILPGLNAAMGYCHHFASVSVVICSPLEILFILASNKKQLSPVSPFQKSGKTIRNENYL